MPTGIPVKPLYDVVPPTLGAHDADVANDDVVANDDDSELLANDAVTPLNKFICAELDRMPTGIPVKPLYDVVPPTVGAHEADVAKLAVVANDADVFVRALNCAELDRIPTGILLNAG
jgi:hypothetical protein